MTSHSARVLIRVDAGMNIGIGHLARCLSMASELVGRGVQVTVATRASGQPFESRILAAGARVWNFATAPDSELADGPVWSDEEQLADAHATTRAPGGPWDAVVVDHYHLDHTWEREMARVTPRIVAVDDLANREHAVDVLVDHNWYGSRTSARYSTLIPGHALALIGPRYAMLQSEYRGIRSRRVPAVHPPQRVVVNFGGTDVSGQTVRALGALANFPELAVDVVIGTRRGVTPQLAKLVEESEHFTLHVEIPTLAPLLATADVVIGAGGTATWERLCAGVPAIVTTVSENQSGVTRAFHEAGITRWLGTSANVRSDDYELAIREFVQRPATPVPAIVDGFGAARVAFAVIPAHGTAPTTRLAAAGDVAAYVTAEAAGISAGDGPALWHEREQDFEARRENGTRVEIVEVQGVPVGVVSTGAERVVDIDTYVLDQMDERQNK